jgi:nucleotide-binding universal stress UspA family protein/uncharacterized protein (DUF2267 family)
MLPIRTILHPTDFSDCSRHAGDFAANLARDYRARLVLLHVLELPIHSPKVPAIALAEGHVLRKQAEDELIRLKNAYKDLHCEQQLADGFAAMGIIHVAEEIKPDLIVLGTHGRTGLGRLVMGSVAEDVIRRAPCPVAAVKPTHTPTADYEDWIDAAMASPKQPTEPAEEAIAPEALARAANRSYAATVEHTVRATNRWLRDVRIRLGEKHSHHAFRVLRAVLHVLRDHLSIDHVASLGAQMPLLLRGIVYEGWDPSHKPEKHRHKTDFVSEVKAQLAPEPLDCPEWAIHAVLVALGNHLSAGESAKLKRALPYEIRELWEVQRTKGVAAGEFV